VETVPDRDEQPPGASAPSPEAAPSPDAAAPDVRYRAGLAPAVRSGGRVLVGAAVVVVVAVLVRLAGGWARTLSDVLIVVAVVAALFAAARGVLVALGRGPRLVLGAAGFANHTRPPFSARREPRTGSWADVRTIQAVREGGRRLLVICLTDDRQSVIVLRRLAASPADIEVEVQRRLDVANGYRDYGILTAPPKAPRPTAS
jgi:hypothetical protein